MAHRQRGTKDAPVSAGSTKAPTSGTRADRPPATEAAAGRPDARTSGKGTKRDRKHTKRDRALARLDRKLADARLEVERRSRQLARANSDVAALEARRAALLDEDRVSAALAGAAKDAAPSAGTRRPVTRPRTRRSPRPGSADGPGG